MDLDAFIAEHYASVVRSVALACGDAHGAEDAVQHALVGVLGRRRTTPVEHLPGWVVAVALNSIRRRHRRAALEQRAYQRLVPLEVTVGAPPDERLIDLRDALAALPMRQRQVVILYYLHDLDVASIAAACGISTGSVKTSLFRARAHLAESLAPATVSSPGSRDDCTR